MRRNDSGLRGTGSQPASGTQILQRRITLGIASSKSGGAAISAPWAAHLVWRAPWATRPAREEVRTHRGITQPPKCATRITGPSMACAARSNFGAPGHLIPASGFGTWPLAETLIAKAAAR